MNSLSEQKPREGTGVYSKKRILCKFWMKGQCTKEDKCDYLHEGGQFQPGTKTECSMYKLGFCKNGPLCPFKHVKEAKTQEEVDALPELPIWFLECLMGKPLDLIFQDYEALNKSEVDLLKAKYISKKPKINTPHYNWDIYADKKNNILQTLVKKTRYFFIRNRNMDFVQFSMETNLLLTFKSNALKIRECAKSCEEIVFIIFDSETGNFNGFCKLRKVLEEAELAVISDHYFNSYSRDFFTHFKESTSQPAYLSIEWHWKTKLSGIKVELLRNPLNENEQFIASKDFQEVSVELGYYICRMMIKRLTKEEVKQYMDYKRMTEQNALGSNSSYLLPGTSSHSLQGPTFNNYNNENYEMISPLLQEEKTNLLNSFIESSYPGVNNNNSTVNEGISQTQTQGNMSAPVYDNVVNSTSHTQMPGTSNIIVTNISNLQVNISHSRSHKNKNRSRSRSRSRKRNKHRSRSRSRDRSKNKYREKDNYRNKDKYRDKNYYREDKSKYREKDNYREDRNKYKDKDNYRDNYRDKSRSHNKKRQDEINKNNPKPSPTSDIPPTSSLNNKLNLNQDTSFSLDVVDAILKEDQKRKELNKVIPSKSSSTLSILNQEENASDYNYESDATVVVKEEVGNTLESLNPTFAKKRSHDEENIEVFSLTSVNSHSPIRSSKNLGEKSTGATEPKQVENKVIKNKLFSNAMEKLALNYLKKDYKAKN